MSIDQYSSSPANNDLANYFQTGMRPSAVKTAGWDIMADLKGNLWSLPTASGTGMITIANSRPVAAASGTDPFKGQLQWFLPAGANGGAVTLAIDGQNAKHVFAYGADLLGGELQANTPALVKYDGTQWQLLNPQDATGSFTITLTGCSGAAPTGLVNWRITKGKIVYINVPSNINGTSNSISMAGNGIPAVLNANSSKNVFCRVRDNNASQFGSVDVSNTGTWVFHNGSLITGGGFTNTSAKGLDSYEFTYTLD